MTEKTSIMPELPILASVDNFRDIAGKHEGYRVPGGRLQRGLVYRSNRLEASDGDLATLEGLGIEAVHDLREDHEIEKHPNRAIPGSKYIQHSVFGIPMAVVEALSTTTETFDAMILNYETFVTDPRCLSGISSVLTAIANASGPQLFHCAAGKDRTGWVALLIHHIVGLDRDTMIADYLLTDEYATNSRVATLDSILEALGPERGQAYEPAFRCDTAYMDAALNKVNALHGDLDGYIADGLGLSSNTIDSLRHRLVAPE